MTARNDMFRKIYPQEGRRMRTTTPEIGGADMTDTLSRRARTILAMDALLMATDENPSLITKENIATKAAEWTTDELDMFDDDGDYPDYYSIINSLMHIVHAMRGGDA